MTTGRTRRGGDLHGLLRNSLTELDSVADLCLVGVAVIAPHFGGVDVGGRLVVGLGQHGHDGQKNGFDALDRGPSLGRTLIGHGIGAGLVEDGNAHITVRENCGKFCVNSISAFWGKLLGCHMGVVNFILGGFIGYVGGNAKVARNTPPSYSVPSGPIIAASQSR